jgi:hypothetical protein
MLAPTRRASSRVSRLAAREHAFECLYCRKDTPTQKVETKAYLRRILHPAYDLGGVL